MASIGLSVCCFSFGAAPDSSRMAKFLRGVTVGLTELYRHVALNGMGLTDEVLEVKKVFT